MRRYPTGRTVCLDSAQAHAIDIASSRPGLCRRHRDYLAGSALCVPWTKRYCLSIAPQVALAAHPLRLTDRTLQQLRRNSAILDHSPPGGLCVKYVITLSLIDQL